MTDASQFPLSLYKANLDLWLRIGELLQENRDQWMHLVARELEDNLVETRAEALQLQEAGDWASLAILPGSALWRIAQQQLGDLEAVAQTAAGNQLTFANGFQQALSDWQDAVAGAFGDTATGLPTPDALLDTLRGFTESVVPAAITVQASTSSAPAARRPAAKRAAKRVPAKKAAAKRAAKKTASRKATKKTARKATRKAAKKAAKKTAARRVAKSARKRAAR